MATNPAGEPSGAPRVSSSLTAASPGRSRPPPPAPRATARPARRTGCRARRPSGSSGPGARRACRRPPRRPAEPQPAALETAVAAGEAGVVDADDRRAPGRSPGAEHGQRQPDRYPPPRQATYHGRMDGHHHEPAAGRDELAARLRARGPAVHPAARGGADRGPRARPRHAGADQRGGRRASTSPPSTGRWNCSRNSASSGTPTSATARPRTGRPRTSTSTSSATTADGSSTPNPTSSTTSPPGCAPSSGFELDRSHFTVFGRCADCVHGGTIRPPRSAEPRR